MTIDTEINLPPLPGALVDVETEARAYARAAVEADRADHLRGVTKMIPSDAGIMEIWRPYRHFPPDWICGFAHALLSRYSSDRLAEVRCNHCGWRGADVDLVRDVAADEPEDGAADVCPRCKRIGDLQDIGQPAASAEPNTHIDDDAVDHFAAAMKDKLAQARAKGRHGWHECAPADLSAMLRAHVEKGDPRDVANFCMFLWSLGQPISAAPVAQEPIHQYRVRNCSDWYDGLPDNSDGKDYETRTLYAAPVAAQAQPTPYAGSFLAALDKALALDRTESSWSLKKTGSPGERAEAWAEVRRLRAALEAPAQHPDDAAVDRFAAAMKTKLAQKRAEGRGGWEDKAQCSQDRLSLMLRGHVAKGDPVDVGNFCMMLHQRGERISGRDAASPSAQDREDDEALADTQRAIIEAAERRGYERGLAECAQDREDAPSIWNPLTPYGVLVRALRIVAGTTLMEMSEGTGYTPSYLSGIEFGRNPVTDGVIGCTWSFLEDKGINVPLSVFRKAADRAAKGADHG